MVTHIFCLCFLYYHHKHSIFTFNKQPPIKKKKEQPETGKTYFHTPAHRSQTRERQSGHNHKTKNNNAPTKRRPEIAHRKKDGRRVRDSRELCDFVYRRFGRRHRRRLAEVESSAAERGRCATRFCGSAFRVYAAGCGTAAFRWTLPLPEMLFESMPRWGTKNGSSSSP